MAGIGEGARWALVIVFLLASLEKASVLRAKAAAWHPVMLRSPRRRRHATALVTAALFVDAVSVATLLVVPRVGGAIALALVMVYSLAGLRTHAPASDKGCGCFWGFLNTSSRAGFLVRNLALVGLASLVAIQPRSTQTSGLLAAAFMIVILAGVAQVDRLLSQRAGARTRGADEEREGTVPGEHTGGVGEMAALGEWRGGGP